MKILLAADGSECSRKAVEKCCELAAMEKGAEVKIVGVVEPVTPMAAEPFAISYDFYAQVEEDLRKQIKAALAAAEKSIGDQVGGKNITIKCEVLTGNPKRIIVDEAKKSGADLIVMGSHGYGFLDRALLGSVSDFVVHHAPCSVLIVRS